MSHAAEEPAKGWRVFDVQLRLIGTVDAAFADYLLVRTRGWLPVDLYVPRNALRLGDEPKTAIASAADAEEAYAAWHRPLKAAPHD